MGFQMVEEGEDDVVGDGLQLEFVEGDLEPFTGELKQQFDAGGVARHRVGAQSLRPPTGACAGADLVAARPSP